MPVSYQSTTFKNSPYVPPVDLGLLTNVLSYQQSKFDTNALKIQSRIDQLATMDVMKDEDREYLNNKVNNLVNNLNNLGGVNLADTNVSNSIESYASDIYQDNNVINAISSTKRIRNLQSSYEKYRTDPKLSKFYSDANYTLDMANVQSYLGDGQVGSSYQGNSSATPFYDYNKDFKDIFKGLEANKYSKVWGSGYYLNKETKEYVSAEQVAEEARGLMSMNARSQMERDATYLYKFKAGYGKDQVVEKALEVDKKSLVSLDQVIKQTTNDILLENDPKNKQTLKTNLAAYKEMRNQQASQIEANKVNYSRLYDTNPTELMYKGFSDDYFKALGLRYSYSQTENSITADPVKAMIFGAQERRYLKQIDIDAAKDLLNTRLGAERENLLLQLQAKGLQLDADGKLVAAQNTSLVPDIISNTDPNAEEGYYTAAKDRVQNQIPNQITKYMDDYWAKIASTNKYDLAGIIDSPTYDINQDGSVNLQDFLDMRDPALSEKYKDRISKATLDGKQADIIYRAVTGYLAASRGENILVSEFPEGTSELVENINLLKFEQQSLNKGIKKYEGGERGFFRDIYSGGLIPDDAKTQGSPAIGSIKSYLKANNIITDEDVKIVKVGRNPNGVENSYGIWYKVKDEAATFIETPAQIAQVAGITAGPYDVLNGNVTLGNDFETTVQNVKDGRFVAQIRVYKNGNNNEYGVSYLYHNPKTNSTQDIKIPLPYQTTPALAYDAVAKFIKNYEIKGVPPGQYKEAFEDIILNKKYIK